MHSTVEAVKVYGRGGTEVRALDSVTISFARGQFTGGQVASTTRGGTNDLSGSFAYALRDPSLEFATGDNSSTSTFSGQYTQHQLSGGLNQRVMIAMALKMLFFDKK